MKYIKRKRREKNKGEPKKIHNEGELEDRLKEKQRNT